MKKNILLLNSYHQGMSWVDNLTRAVNDTLRPEKNHFALYIENMDTKRHNSDAYYKTLTKLYQQKYRNIKFDLILASDNNAFDFLLENRDMVFGNVPVAFSGVNDFRDEMLEGVHNFTGVAETPSPNATVEFILKAHPDVKNIYIINDYLKTGRAWEKTIKKELQGFEERVNLLYSENLSLAELKETIESFRDDTVILMGVFFADREHRYITYEKTGTYLLDTSRVPVYCLVAFNLSDGVIGGKLISGYHQGKLMAQLGRKILEGQQPETLPVIKEDSNQYIFNYRGMEKFGVDESLLPEESTVLNRPSSLYEEYKNIILTMLVIIIIALVLVVLTLGYLKFRKEKDDIKEGVILIVLQFAPVVIIPLIVIFLVYVFMQSGDSTYQNFREKLRNELIENNKALASERVQRAIDLTRIPELDQTRILEEIKKGFVEKEDYVFIMNRQGEMILHPDSSIIGVNVLELKNAEGELVNGHIAEFLKSRESGFVEYMWKNPLSLKREKKISYLQSIPEFGWVAGSGVFLEDIERLLLERDEENRKVGKDNIYFLFSLGIGLALLSFALSIFISRIISKVFGDYRESVQDEIEKNKQKDKMLFEQAKKAAMGDLIGVIAHQLKQPLNVISLRMDHLLDLHEFNKLTEKALHEYVEETDKSIHFMTKTIDDFRNFFRPDKKPHPFDLKMCIDNGVSLIDSQLQKNGIRLIQEVESGVTVNNYEHELQQVLINLITNSKDVLVEKGIEDGWIRIVLGRDAEGNAQIEVRDNGGGIPDEIQGKIFDSYFTTKAEKGTGIGLHLAKMIVEDNMRGKIRFFNVEAGAVFIIMLSDLE